MYGQRYFVHTQKDSDTIFSITGRYLMFIKSLLFLESRKPGYSLKYFNHLK